MSVINTLYATVVKIENNKYNIITISQYEDNAIKAARTTAIFNNKKNGFVIKFNIETAGIIVDISYGKIVTITPNSQEYKVENTTFLNETSTIDFLVQREYL